MLLLYGFYEFLYRKPLSSNKKIKKNSKNVLTFNTNDVKLIKRLRKRQNETKNNIKNFKKCLTI